MAPKAKPKGKKVRRGTGPSLRCVAKRHQPPPLPPPPPVPIHLPPCHAIHPHTLLHHRLRCEQKESEEQRRARQELEALAAAEAEAERRAAARRELGERAAREAALSAANSRALDAAWLQRMRAAKLEELQAEARVLSREHDAAVDRHDRLIEVGAGGRGTGCPSPDAALHLARHWKVGETHWRTGSLVHPTHPNRPRQALLEEVAGADVQHGAAAAQHAEVLDQLLGLHGQRMAALRAQFEGDLAAVAQEFEWWGSTVLQAVGERGRQRPG